MARTLSDITWRFNHSRCRDALIALAVLMAPAIVVALSL